MNNQNSTPILSKAFNRAIGGGLSGAGAMVIQVSSLMWLRTTMNYQYRYGTKTLNTMKYLYNDGGIKRFYRGYPYALMIGPLSRFGDTASNAYAMSYLEDKKIPTSIKTLMGSAIASGVRVSLMPIDALKTTLQVEGKEGVRLLRTKINTNGARVLFNGSLASMSATFVGHYPWFLTYNILNKKIENYEKLHLKLMRNGFIGFSSAVVSDCCSNSLRVIKTTKQTHKENITYKQAVNNIIEHEGVKGLFGRGLKTRIITNGIQGIIFTICWKFIEEKFFSKH